MRLATVPAAAGALWVRQGFAVFFLRPMAFAAMFASFLFAGFLLMLVPLFGPLLLSAVLPMVSLGFMVATRVVLDGHLPTPRSFVAPLHSDQPRRKAYVQLSAFYALATVAILWLSDVADGGALDALMEGMASGKMTPEQVAELVADPRLSLGLVLRFGLAALLAVPFWHAPALVHWDAQSCAKSLFSSSIACWRNKAAFTVYSLTWTAVIVIFALATSMVFALLGHAELIAIVTMPASLMFSTVFYASLYFSYAACFAPEPEPEPAELLA